METSSTTDNNIERRQAGSAPQRAGGRPACEDTPLPPSRGQATRHRQSPSLCRHQLAQQLRHPASCGHRKMRPTGHESLRPKSARHGPSGLRQAESTTDPGSRSTAFPGPGNTRDDPTAQTAGSLRVTKNNGQLLLRAEGTCPPQACPGSATPLLQGRLDSRRLNDQHFPAGQFFVGKPPPGATAVPTLYRLKTPIKSISKTPTGAFCAQIGVIDTRCNQVIHLVPTARPGASRQLDQGRANNSAMQAETRSDHGPKATT